MIVTMFVNDSLKKTIVPSIITQPYTSKILVKNTDENQAEDPLQDLIKTKFVIYSVLNWPKEFRNFEKFYQDNLLGTRT